MTSQFELDFHAKAPEVSDVDVERLCTYLEGKGWVKAPVIEADLKFNERKIRKISEHSEGMIFSYPGSPGYKLFTGAIEIDEFERGDSLLSAQVTGIIRRRATYRRRFHQVCRP